jgi:hypothetical protein
MGDIEHGRYFKVSTAACNSMDVILQCTKHGFVIPSSRVLSVKTIVAQLFKKVLAFHGKESFIAVFEKAGIWNVS